eukprot:SAG11_NODE_3242_length_2588_cov_1.515468_2_plen_145_part_00
MQTFLKKWMNSLSCADSGRAPRTSPLCQATRRRHGGRQRATGRAVALMLSVRAKPQAWRKCDGGKGGGTGRHMGGGIGRILPALSRMSGSASAGTGGSGGCRGETAAPKGEAAQGEAAAAAIGRKGGGGARRRRGWAASHSQRT